MSKQVDWSQAPEWANVLLKNVHVHYLMAWAESFDDGSMFINFEGDGGKSLDTSRWRILSSRPSTKSWSGEGLPPVGVVCRIITDNSAWWKYSGLTDGEDVTVCHSFKNSKGYDMVVVEACNGACLAATVECVAPISTPDQIAADERQKMADMLWQRYLQPILAPAQEARVKTALGLMYDAGYRKQEAK